MADAGFGFPREIKRQPSLVMYRSGILSFKYEVPGTYAVDVPDWFKWAVLFLSGGGGGGGSSDGAAGSEGGGGGAGAGFCKKTRVRQGWRFVMTVPAGGAGASFTGAPIGPGATGGTASCAIYNELGSLVSTLSAAGGAGGDSTAVEASPGGAGGSPSETLSIIFDAETLFSQVGKTGDNGRTFGNDVGGYGAETHLKLFDPFESRSRGVGGPSNNTSGSAGVAPGSGGGGGVGSGSGGSGAPGIAWLILLPDDLA